MTAVSILRKSPNPVEADVTLVRGVQSRLDKKMSIRYMGPKYLGQIPMHGRSMDRWVGDRWSSLEPPIVMIFKPVKEFATPTVDVDKL
jgi:hypothetical protein